MLYCVVVVLRLLELSDSLHSSHSPVGKLPRFRPPNVHVFGVEDHNYQFEFVIHYARAQTRSCVWCDSSLDSVDASLAEHQVSIEPLVISLVSIGVLLHIVELGAAYFSEPGVLHADS